MGWVMGRDLYAEPLHRTSLGLGGGFLLVAAGATVFVLGVFDVLPRHGVAIAAIVAGLVLVAFEVLRLRRWPGRSQLIWPAVIDSILVGAVVLAIAPIIAIVRGFADLAAQSKIQGGGDWIAYGFAFTGLFLGAIFFAYAVKYYLSTLIVLLTSIATGGRKPRGNGHNNGNNKGN